MLPPSLKIPNIRIVFRDSSLLVVSKPAGLLSQQSKDPDRPDLRTLLAFEYPYLRLMHRLDLGTSGLICFSLDPQMNLELDQMLASGHKVYRALCLGVKTEIWPSEGPLIVENHLKDGEPVNIVRSGGKKARTEFYCLREDKAQNQTLVSAILHTGRRHQIRVHLASIGLPVVGDDTYGLKGTKEPRMFLHCYHLKLHYKGRELELFDPLPEFHF